jgi:rhamnogalacturonan acetylesterase
MKVLLLSACLSSAFAANIPRPPGVPALWLTGDSKMALGGGGNGTQGWGEYLHYSFDPSTLFINNSAIAGRSARSYTREGHFADVAKHVKKGDWVLIEFGTNDGGSPYPAASDNGRADCPGAGNQTCPTVYL